MLAFIAKRLGLALLVALAVSVIAFFLLRLSGDVATAIAGEGAREEDIAMVRQAYGLDRPLLIQYFDWLWHVLRGDLGSSLFFKTDVIDLVRDKLPTTLTLGLLSLGFALLVSIPLGVLAATFAGMPPARGCADRDGIRATSRRHHFQLSSQKRGISSA